MEGCIMYYVQYKAVGEGGNDQWVIEKKFASLDVALEYATAEALDAHSVPHRVLTTKKSGGVKVLAKFKPLRNA
jgi:hypothetical protein